MFTACMDIPGVGASWEGFVLEQATQIPHPNAAHFWGTQAGAELDLVFQFWNPL
ncbi:DUF4143 domain-containing protein [Longilinea arvoryzae]|uniref:DUF4143 domain-containing protein n=1 Tax=Longilinea arvoryzae TaxID=360412 RepID=UPI001F34B3B4|nr:DUF4143 domain-containing protein [Longilinea arvoryzae]